MRYQRKMSEWDGGKNSKKLLFASVKIVRQNEGRNGSPLLLPHNPERRACRLHPIGHSRRDCSQSPGKAGKSQACLRAATILCTSLRFSSSSRKIRQNFLLADVGAALAPWPQVLCADEIKTVRSKTFFAPRERQGETEKNKGYSKN